MYNMSYLKTALNAAKTAVPAVGIPASLLSSIWKGGANTASNLSQGGNISGLTYNSPTYKPEYGSTVATQETPLPQSAPQSYVPPAPAPTQSAPTSNFNGSSQYSDEDIVNLFNEMSGSLNKGNVYNQQLGGSAIDQLSRLQAQKANEKAGRTGLYEIDPNMAFSPDQIRQQRNAADAFYDEQLGKYAGMAQKESSSTNKGFGVDSILSGLSTPTVSLITRVADKFGSEQIVKNFNIVQNSAIQAKKISDRLGDGNSLGADDLRLVFLFAKAQDPDSVVRETEYDNAQKMISTLPASIRQKVSTVFSVDEKTGKGVYSNQAAGFLTPEGRKEIVNALIEQYQGNKVSYDNLKKQYVQRINNFAGADIGNDLLIGYEEGFDPGSTGYSSQGSTQPTMSVNPNDPISWESLNY